MRKIKDIIIKESIISNSGIGVEENIKSWLKDELYANDKEYTIDNGFVHFWGKGSAELSVDYMPNYIKFAYFEPVNSVVIAVDGDDAYDKFLKAFNCNIGSYSDYKNKRFITVYIKNVKTVKWNDFNYEIFGCLKFEKCDLDFSCGLPKITGKLETRKCKIQKPYDLHGIEEIKFN